MEISKLSYIAVGGGKIGYGKCDPIIKPYPTYNAAVSYAEEVQGAFDSIVIYECIAYSDGKITTQLPVWANGHELGKLHESDTIEISVHTHTEIVHGYSIVYAVYNRRGDNAGRIEVIIADSNKDEHSCLFYVRENQIEMVSIGANELSAWNDVEKFFQRVCRAVDFEGIQGDIVNIYYDVQEN